MHKNLKPAKDRFGLYTDVSINNIAMRMRWIPPGEFWMGSPAEEEGRFNSEGPLHKVTISGGFWLGETPCTQALWEAVTGKNPSRFKGSDRSVERVSWDDCQDFLKRINKGFGEALFRLPTEAEWEYACRAGTTTPFCFGETITTDQANFDGNYPYANGEKGIYKKETLSVKALPRNGWGVYQMHGNVWEWCQDWLGDYPQDPVADPKGPDEGARRVLRGGSWISYAWDVRSAYRLASVPETRNVYVGFRLARG